MGIALAAGVIGAAGAVGGSLLQASAAKKAAKKASAAERQATEADAAEREKYSQMIQAERWFSEQNLKSNEQAQMNIFGSMGDPSTYNAPSQYGGPLTSLAPMGLNGLNTSAGVLMGGTSVTKSGAVTGADVSMGGRGKYKGTKQWSITDEIADPGQLTAAVQNTSGFRTVSKMVGDAEQLMNKTGPVWNELQNGVIGSIYGSSAEANRQAMEQSSAMIAKMGGSARTGMNWVTAMRTQSNINRTRTNELWSAKLSLEKWTAEYAQSAQSFAQGWVRDAFGVRDMYTANLNNLRTFWSRTWPAGAAQLNQGDTQMMMASAESRRNAMVSASNTKIAGITSAISGFAKVAAGVGQQFMGSSSYGGSSSQSDAGLQSMFGTESSSFSGGQVHFGSDVGAGGYSLSDEFWNK